MNICFFCSASNDLDAKYYSEAKNLTREISNRGWTTVTGGSNVGVMQTIMTNSAKTISVIPQIFSHLKLETPNNEIIITEDIQERKKILYEKSDIFVVLPGGFGTIDELTEVIILKFLTKDKKDIIIFNQDGFYDNLQKQFEIFVDEKFAKKEVYSSFIFLNSVSDIINYIEKKQ